MKVLKKYEVLMEMWIPEGMDSTEVIQDEMSLCTGDGSNIVDYDIIAEPKDTGETAEYEKR